MFTIEKKSDHRYFITTEANKYYTVEEYQGEAYSVISENGSFRSIDVSERKSGLEIAKQFNAWAKNNQDTLDAKLIVGEDGCYCWDREVA